MKHFSFGRALAAASFAFAVSFSISAAPAGAMGTVLIRQADGATDVYHDVSIKLIRNVLYMTSADGRGTLVISRAACAYQGMLLVCFAAGATLVQAGKTSPLDFKHGTLYVNTTDDAQRLPLSTAKVPAHSLLLSFTTLRGTYVSLNGRVDKVVK